MMGMMTALACLQTASMWMIVGDLRKLFEKGGEPKKSILIIVADIPGST
jgi:hypothetical protein